MASVGPDDLEDAIDGPWYERVMVVQSVKSASAPALC